MAAMTVGFIFQLPARNFPARSWRRGKIVFEELVGHLDVDVLWQLEVVRYGLEDA
jgi:hypothetical protein